MEAKAEESSHSNVYNLHWRQVELMVNGSDKKKEDQTVQDLSNNVDEIAPLKALNFEARRKEIFGDRVLKAVEDFLRHRHRDWEQ